MIVFEFIKLSFYITIIVLICKYWLMKSIRNLAICFNLKTKTIGYIEGITTSVPELFTVSLASLVGLTGTSIYNILSSNLINFIQYALTIILNKNIIILKNKALIIDVFIAIITILIPTFMLKNNIDFGIQFVILSVFMYFFFLKINTNAHNLYLNEYETKIIKNKKEEIKEEKRWKSRKKKVIGINIIYLILTIVFLYFVGENLTNNLVNLCDKLKIPEYIVGFILGFGSSLPELITFIEAQRTKKLTGNKEIGVIEATNNLISSNMLNLFIVQSVGVILYKISF